MGPARRATTRPDHEISIQLVIMQTSKAVILSPLQSPFRSRPEETDCLLPRLCTLPYQPIDSENGEIRLVEVLPGRHNDVIQINLHTRNFSDKPNYEALSYAWGTTSSSNRAIINGCPVPVRESLDLGLRRLRLTDEPRTLWVDALCINQNDVRERSHQVQQMCRIYKSAKQVVIWLGEWPHIEFCAYSEKCQTRWTQLLGRAPRTGYLNHHLCQHALEISKLPWFRRLWIVQEFVLASKSKIILGDHVTSSHHFIHVILRCLKELIDEKPGSYYLYSDLRIGQREHIHAKRLHWHISMLLEMSDSFHESGGVSLYGYSVLSRHTIATDPRDRIYGLLGILKSYVAEPILPDYSKAWPQVLAEATMVMISEDGLFPYMSRGFVFPSTEQPKEGYQTPSWVLEFSQPDEKYYPFTFMDKYHGHKLDSSGTERRRRSLRLSNDFRTLYKHGWHVGTIRTSFVFATNAALGDSPQCPPELAAGLYDFYHQVLKPRGIAPSRLYEAIHSKLYPRCNLEGFVSSLRGHRDQFMRMYLLDRDKDNFAVFTTEEGDVGATWLGNTFEIRADDIIVALFERQMPFVLRPVPGDSTYRMVNLAYIPGLSDPYIQFHSDVTWGNLDKVKQVPNDWIDDAANGCSEYAIV